MAINTPFMVTEVDASGKAVGPAKFATTLANAQAVGRDMIRQAPSDHQVYLFKIHAHVDVSVSYNVVIDPDPVP